MLLNKKSRRITTFTIETTPEEARKIRRQKELDKMPTLENMFKRAKRNARRRELKEKYSVDIQPSKKNERRV